MYNLRHFRLSHILVKLGSSQKLPIAFVVASCVFASNVNAGNIQLDATVENCAKIVGYTENFITGVADSVGSPKSSVEWIGPLTRKYWKECVVQFKAPRGVFDCPVFMILSSDNGKTAFAQTFSGGPRCEKLD